MKNTQWCLIALVLTHLTVAVLEAEELPILTAALYAADENAASSDEPYRDGRRALDENRWSEAARLFAKSAKSNAGHADAAHYWRAYALHKDGQSAKALEVLGEMRRTYKSSSWLDDSEALELEIREGSGRSSAPRPGGDEELKLLALNGLMHNDSDRALPLIRKFLDGEHSIQLRERALFVLSQSDSSEAAAWLEEIARGNQHRELQTRAVHFLGISGTPGAVVALEEIYRSTAEPEVKEKVLQSLMIADEETLILEVARTETDENLRRAAIQQLGVMDATGALRQLWKSESSVEVKKQILQSFFIADDTETLLDVARTETDDELRRTAIRNLGLVGSTEAIAALTDMYAQLSDTDSRRAIIEAFFLSDQIDRLIRIAKTETDLELRKEAVQRLSLMDSEEALAFLMEILDQ